MLYKVEFIRLYLLIFMIAIKPEGEMNEINPKLKKKTKVEFPTAPDGRLLILEKKEEKLPSIEEFDSGMEHR